MNMAIAPTTTKPAKARPMRMDDPAEMSKYPIPSLAAVISETVVPTNAKVMATFKDP